MTPAPSAPPSWAWRRTEFPLDENLHVQSLWGLSDRIVGVASYFDSHYFPTFKGERGWPLSMAPGSVAHYAAGTVVDDRAWFLAYETGLRPSEISLRLFGTNGDENGDWEVRPPSDLDPDHPARLLEHIDGTWVIAHSGEGGNIEIGGPQYLATSRDGVHWSPADVPSLRGVDPFDVSFHGAASTRDVIVVLASVERSGGTEHVLLVSADGDTWREVAPPDQFDWPTDIACNDTTCVMTRFEFRDHLLPYPLPIAWVSTDGVTWTGSETTLTDPSSGGGIEHVVAADRGFVGIERGRAGIVWISSEDGRTWRRYDALSSSLGVPIIDIAAGGGYVVALEQEPDTVPQAAWVGFLPAMRIAPE